jgi:hypothetical protein
MPPEEEKRVATELAVLANEVKNLSENMGKRLMNVEKEVYNFRGILDDQKGFNALFQEKLEQEKTARKEAADRDEKTSGRRWAIGLATYSSLFAAFLFALWGLIEAVVKHLCKV